MKISRRILLLSNKKTNFLTTTINSYLQEKDFEVIFTGFDAEEMSRIKEMPSLILLNFENIDDKDKQFLCHLRDVCMAEERWVYLCGNEHEIKFVSTILPKGVIAATCSRPFDIPEMINKMIKEIQDEERRQGQPGQASSSTEEVDISAFKKILLISNKKSSFLTTKIKSSLQQEDFEVMFCGFDIDEVSQITEKPNLILLNFENIEKNDKQFLFYIRDLCVEEEKSVFLCGHENEIKDIVNILPKGAVMGAYKRPISIPELVSRMLKEVDKYKQDHGKRHILVVDDSGEMLRTIKAWLSDIYRISIVNSGANAILFLANQKPDLILLDYEMPFCNGPQMMEMIRAESSTSTIPIMFLTGRSDKESLIKVLSLKPEGYILKSTNPDKIKEVIGKFFIDQKAKKFNNGMI